VIKSLPIIFVPNSHEERGMAFALRPINCLLLRLECAERAAGVIFDNEIRDWGPFAIALRAGLNVNVRQFRSASSLRQGRIAHIGQ
jgi:hypothetical protein